MNIMLPETLKTLRRKRGNTQDDLAQHLGMSMQSVSKWERGDGYPDIELLPAIAAFYGVTVDDLLGVGELRKAEKIAAYKNQIFALRNKGDVPAALAIAREAYAEFPMDAVVISSLAGELWSNAHNNGDWSEKDELIRLCETVIHIATPEQHLLRESALQLLCYTYQSTGNTAQAKKYAQLVSDDALMATLLEGDEYIRAEQSLIMTNIDSIFISVIGLAGPKPGFDDKRKLAITLAGIALFDTVYADGDHGFYRTRTSTLSSNAAQLYAKLGEDDAALRCLERAANDAIADDTRTHSTRTSPLVAGTEDDIAQTTKNYENNTSYWRLNSLKNACYDAVRNAPRFRAVEARLCAYAK
ncbi:MAG: helix-turn-helix domain-containing protein [Oscillospiraceae bacterium]|jgi:transcriptional regulator with XRE-family HTH domain|nr:helix-turn-helix domain-containing protein [Oscillospiraceae bacterium]